MNATMNDRIEIPLPICPAKTGDLEALQILVNSAYRGASSQKGWTSEAELLDGQRTDVEALAMMLARDPQERASTGAVNGAGTGDVSDFGDQTLLIYKEVSSLRACVYLKRQGTKAYLGMLTVDPNLQAAGTGKKLLASAEAWVRENWHSEKIEMTVLKQRPALIAWYERRGYVQTARREPFPYGNPRFGLPKIEGLEFIVLEKSL